MSRCLLCFARRSVSNLLPRVTPPAIVSNGIAWAAIQLSVVVSIGMAGGALGGQPPREEHVAAASPTDATTDRKPDRATGSATRTGSETGAKASFPAAFEEQLEGQRRELAARIDLLSQTAPADGGVEVVTDNEDELERLRTLDSLLGLRLAAHQQRLDIDSERARLQESLERLRAFGPDEPKPYSFLLLDDLRDQLDAEVDREQAANSDRKTAEQVLEAVRDEFDRNEQERRLAAEDMENNDEPDSEATLSRELRLAVLQSSISREAVALRKQEIELKTARIAQCQLQQTLLNEKLDRVSQNVTFTDRDLQSRLNDLQRRATELKRKLREAEGRLARLEGEQASELRRLEDPTESSSARGEVTNAYRVARRCLHEEITLLNQHMVEIDRYRYFWECRFAVVNGRAKADELPDWRERIGEFLTQLRQSEHSLALRLDELRLDQATLFRRASELAESSSASRRWVDFESDQLRRLSDVCEMGIIQLKAGQRSAHRLQADLDARLEPESNADYLGPMLAWASSAWSYEIASVDDRPITIGKIVLLVVYCGLGLIVARIVGRVTAKRLLPRFGLNEGAIHAIHSILFYALSVMFGLLSLEVVHLPFAAFTFLGGAAAIGIGFGSQNILNNFISGLILLAEQPIRVGDLVEIDGVQGTVEHIGARSTRVRTASNHELIVPNSKLLENRVVNLTLSDDLVQTCLGTSIVPTMPLDEARRLLRHCAASHPKVLPSPEPLVLLREFSTTAVVFELHFWLRMNRVMECRIVESEIRETICDVFRGSSPKSVSRDGKPENAGATQQRLAG